MLIINPKNPLAEVFGYPINNETPEAKLHRSNKFCPYHNKTPNCTKVSKIDPLGVCTMFAKEKPIITCPVRFRQSWTMIADAAMHFFGEGALYMSLPEVRLQDKRGRKAGNIDYVLVKHDDRGRILDFASLEVQSVYISGTIRGAFKTYMENQSPDFEWVNVANYPHPDYLSSSTKRLVPQMLTKGGIFNQWGKKQAIAVQTAFYDTLPPITEVAKDEADVAWLLYDLVLAADEMNYILTHSRTVYTTFENVSKDFIYPQADDIKKFTGALQKAVSAKLNGQSTAGLSILGEDDEAEEEEDDDTV